MSTPAQSSENTRLQRRQGIMQPLQLLSGESERAVDWTTRHDMQSIKTGMANKGFLVPL